MKLISTHLGKLRFFYKEGDKVIGERIALGKYEEFETMQILRCAQNDMVAVDVGANIGYYTLLLARKCKKIYAIEPDRECFEILRKNVEENKLKNVVLINKAAGDRNEKVRIEKNKNNFGDSKTKSLSPASAGASPFEERETIQAIKLDGAIKEKVDLMKIDVQGWEPQVVEGARKIIKRDSPIIFVEYNPKEYKDERMIKFLRTIYPIIWQIDYWFYIYKRTDGKIKVDRKTGYTNLWMKKDVSCWDFVRGYKNVQIKKVIKAIMGIWQK